MRITVQLIDAHSDEHLWSESYHRELRNILQLQGEVARAVAQKMRVSLTPAERERLTKERPVKPEAHEAYLNGRFSAHRGRGSLTSTEFFEKAVELDPGYAEAYAALAASHILSLPTHNFMPQARTAALRALELDDTLAEGHAALAMVKFFYD